MTIESAIVDTTPDAAPPDAAPPAPPARSPESDGHRRRHDRHDPEQGVRAVLHDAREPGLGLTSVAVTAALLGGSIEIGERAPHGARVDIDLPLLEVRRRR